MDDLNGLDWSASSRPTINKPPVTGTGNYYTTLRPPPAASSSGRSTPLSAQTSGAFKPPASVPKSSTPDSFANLVSFGAAKQTNNLTLQEQHERLQAEKARKAEEQRKQYESQFGHSQFWDGLGAKPSTVRIASPGNTQNFAPATTSTLSPGRGSAGILGGTNEVGNGRDDDLFAAFNADTKVDSSSYYPPPSLSTSSKSTPSQNRLPDFRGSQAPKQLEGNGSLGELGDDDDPFGLEQMSSGPNVPAQSLASADDTDDFLGDLGKPVEEVKRQAKASAPKPDAPELDEDHAGSEDPWDKAVSELVDMGFSAENSRRALTESGAGLDVQAAVGWLLNDAHRQAKEKSQSRSGSARPSNRENGSSASVGREISIDRSRKEAIPAWMQQEGRSPSQPNRDDSRSPAHSDSDISRTAAAVGSNLLKTANSLWKTSQKKVQKAVSELSQDSDASQPKWMRDASSERQQPRERQARPEDTAHGREEPLSRSTPIVTDEALMLEADSRPMPRKGKPIGDPRFLASASASPREHSPASNPSTGRSTPIPRWQQSTSATAVDARSRLSKHAVEEQSAQAYVSPARRKKATPSQVPAEEPDLLFGDGGARANPHSAQPKSSQTIQASKVPAVSKQVKPSSPIPVRPRAPPRNIPSLSPTALATSTQHRLAGTAHFKRGDYSSAHTSYTSSLTALPNGHPITIILLCNRSLTALKTGDPKAAVTDADAALILIGPSRGESETIDLGGDSAGEGQKPMAEFWGKALTRKAEALEQMERWKDAGDIWRQAVEASIGGPTAVQGRQRCERALQPKPKPTQQPPRPQRSALGDLAPPTTHNTAAVKRLRAANAAAEKADDEKFALSDRVDARVSQWREGRKDNLRALLGGLDQVLWEGSGWKKVGMHELVVNGKVKVVYMKAIAKVHPDKLPQNASTEVKMISASVFATLNEAWDKFKSENGM